MTLQAGSTGSDVSELQQQLKDGGYYSGPIDGDYGQSTEDAVRAYQTAHGLTVDGVAGAETWGNIHGDPKYPNNSAGTLGESQPSSTGTALPGGDIDAKIKADYPTLSYLLAGDPDVAKILRDAYTSDPPWSATLIQSKIMGTNWWKTNSDTARNYYNLQFTDPATFQNKLRDERDIVQNTGGEIGYDETVLTPAYVDYFANKALREGLTPAQIKAVMATEITPLIGTTEKSPILNQIRQVQQSYQIAIDQPTQQYWLREIASGRQTIENFQNAIQSQAKAQFPNLTGQFESGLTFKQIIDPYRNIASKLLEKDPEQLDFMGDPKWRHVVDYVDPKTGVHRTMSNVELAQYVKSLPEWNTTQNAVDTYSQIGQTLLQSFGQA